MGLRMLLDKKEVTEIIMPEAEPNETYDQVVMTASERGIPVRQGGTLESIIVDIETEALEEHLSHVIEDFVDSLTAVVYKMVMDNINGEGRFKYRKPE